MNSNAFAFFDGGDRAHARAGRRAVVVLAIILAAGCSVLRAAPDHSRYFVLASTDAATAAAPPRSHPDVHFGVGPVKLPGYLDTQALVRSGQGGSIEYIRNAYWAEPINESFERALLYRTGALLGTTHAVAFPWYATTRVDWKIPVDVLRFEATTNGRAVLVARWSVTRTGDGRVVAGAESVFEESAGDDPVLTVDALSRCVDRLAGAIATAITQASTVAAPAAKAPRRPSTTPATEPAPDRAPVPEPLTSSAPSTQPNTALTKRPNPTLTEPENPALPETPAKELPGSAPEAP